MNILLSVSVALLVGLMMTRLFKPVKLPSVTAYLIAGVLVGPYCLGRLGVHGVGFDTGVLIDERKHVGIRNIRGRLKAMVNGTLEIESAQGVGTKVLITIPKEV